MLSWKHIQLNRLNVNVFFFCRCALFNDVLECRAINVFCFCLDCYFLSFFSDVNQTRQYCSKSNEGIFVACLAAIYIVYLFVSLLSNCTDCSVIVNMSIVGSWNCVSCVYVALGPCVCDCARAFTACCQIQILSHKWHSLRSDDNFNFSFCYLFSLFHAFFPALTLLSQSRQ